VFLSSSHFIFCYFFGNYLVQICIALENYQLLLFLMCKIVKVLTLACVVDFSFRGFPGRGSARSMGNSCATGGSKDLFGASQLLTTVSSDFFVL
jgi:hypothetical protein